MLITSPEFTSNLTGKTYYTKSFDPLDCSTKNVIDGIPVLLDEEYWSFQYCVFYNTSITSIAG
jgi:hypothetical protein